MDEYPQIIRTQEDSKYERDNSVTKLIHVTYWAGKNDGPYTMKFPADTPPADIRAALVKHTADLRTLRGA